MHDQPALLLPLERVVYFSGLTHQGLARLLPKCALRVVLSHSLNVHLLVNVVA